MSLGTDVLTRTVRTQKLFDFGTRKCFYVNIEVSKKNEQNEEEPVIKILNTVCKDKGSCLSKVTEIRFRQKLIVIEDQYVFGWHEQYMINNGERTSSQPTKSSDGSSQSNNQHKSTVTQPKPKPLCKKKLIFKKRFYEDHAQIEKRNTKNIAKNFCKAFINFLEDNNIHLEVRKARKIMEHHNYNNHTIEALGQDSRMRRYFIIFLKEKANEWVQSSKIHDKLIHKQAIRLYLDLMQNRNKLAENKPGKLDMMNEKEKLQVVEASGSIYEEGREEIFEEENDSGK